MHLQRVFHARSSLPGSYRVEHSSGIRPVLSRSGCCEHPTSAAQNLQEISVTEELSPSPFCKSPRVPSAPRRVLSNQRSLLRPASPPRLGSRWEGCRDSKQRGGAAQGMEEASRRAPAASSNPPHRRTPREHGQSSLPKRQASTAPALEKEAAGGNWAGRGRVCLRSPSAWRKHEQKAQTRPSETRPWSWQRACSVPSAGTPASAGTAFVCAWRSRACPRRGPTPTFSPTKDLHHPSAQSNLLKEDFYQQRTAEWKVQNRGVSPLCLPLAGCFMQLLSRNRPWKSQNHRITE